MHVMSPHSVLPQLGTFTHGLQMFGSDSVDVLQPGDVAGLVAMS
jgi:hypothetical protein